MRMPIVATLILPMFVAGCSGTPKTQPANKEAESNVAIATDVGRIWANALDAIILGNLGMLRRFVQKR